VLEVKLATKVGEEPPQWIRDLIDSHLVEAWVVDAEIGSTPVAVGPVLAVKVVFPGHGDGKDRTHGNWRRTDFGIDHPFNEVDPKEKELFPYGVLEVKLAVGPVLAVKVVFPDHGELGVKRDSDTGVAGQLEGGTVVERSHDYESACAASGSLANRSPGRSLRVITAY
jgi:hypothetical protein